MLNVVHARSSHIAQIAPAARSLCLLLCAVLLIGNASVFADSDDVLAHYPVTKTFFPDADHFGDFAGAPPGAPVYKNGKLLGYVILSKDFVAIPAYSGEPINNVIGLRLDGRIAGAAVVEHQEPLLLGGIPPAALEAFVDQYRGKSVHKEIVVGAPTAGQVGIDAITGATITAMVENATVTQAARTFAGARKLRPEPATNRNPPMPAHASVDHKSAAHDEPAASGEETRSGLWRAAWRERSVRIGVLGFGLALLTLILLFQDWLARHPRLLTNVRHGFLVYTIVYIGWYSLGQLSVVNVLTFVHAVTHRFDWGNFLLEPTLFIIWSFVAVVLLLWGRGVYCGWLCPFGAIQELTQNVARRLRVPQFEFPYIVHERLWALKYVILLALFAVSLQSPVEAARYAEIEPFKTVTLHFSREWGYVAFALGMILVSAFNRKLYCKYICPLGAALAIPARLRIFDWLRRRKECGNPCQVCANECEVQAVKPTGEINPNECHHCLDCQVTYWNERKCPPLCEKRKRRERGARARELAAGMGPDLDTAGRKNFAIHVAQQSPSHHRGLTPDG